VTWNYDIETGQGLACLNNLSQRRIVKLRLGPACEELKELIQAVRKDAAGTLNKRRTVHDMRKWVVSLGKKLCENADGARTRGSGKALFEAEDKEELEWAVANSFSRASVLQSSDGDSVSGCSSDSVSFFEHLQFMASFQEGFKSAGFSGGSQGLGKPLSNDSLLDLANTAERALLALQGNSDSEWEDSDDDERSYHDGDDGDDGDESDPGNHSGSNSRRRGGGWGGGGRGGCGGWQGEGREGASGRSSSSSCGGGLDGSNHSGGALASNGFNYSGSFSNGIGAGNLDDRSNSESEEFITGPDKAGTSRK